MARKSKSQPRGVPEWVVIFGDMMSLLLVFFILLQMFSELKQDHEYQRVITAVKEAFGYSGSVGTLPIADPPLRSIIEQLEQLAMKQESTPNTSTSPDESVEGPHMRVTRIRNGLVFSIGGSTTFDPESAEVKEPVLNQLRELASLLAGRENKIVVRGHAANKYLSEDSPWSDLLELSYTRARNVTRILTEYGIDERLFRIEAVGPWEPVRARAVGIQNTAENRRVEVILTDLLAEEVIGDDPREAETLAQGGG